MPNLPSITVTDAQLAKCIDAFTDAAGYKAWLKQARRAAWTRNITLAAELPAPDPVEP